jgi:hypothetical protein
MHEIQVERFADDAAPPHLIPVPTSYPAHTIQLPKASYNKSPKATAALWQVKIICISDIHIYTEQVEYVSLHSN